MANASKDENGISTLLGTLNTTGASTVKIKANASTHSLAVADGTTGTDHGPTNTLRDQNFVTALMGVSSVDGKTPVAVYADSSGNLLIDST